MPEVLKGSALVKFSDNVYLEFKFDADDENLITGTVFHFREYDLPLVLGGE